MPRKVQRTNTISIRLTDEEKLDWELKAHAAGLSISQLAREAMNRVKVMNVGDRAIQIQRTYQIAKIGNNLNQIARWANTYTNTIEAVEVITYLIAIEKALLALKFTKGSEE
ncbi:Mobilization protein [Hyella patelloides LEGE 07179]|uniref:Mobilization protein n=1 Tax=Hyella patelloides LEGE 07179 TaxID=945734 RepID=A0A563VS02_9CYAN|nr:plasmid mobilization relaxosome protein MobC [Hyella patelloides]VEP14186.1 Mobilization protein [Hyella patelloides LEGE 07179]